MEIIQSFIYSFARVKLSLYEQRIMLKIVEQAQIYIKGMWLRENMCRVPHEGGNIEISLVVKDILSEGSKHYEDVKQAVQALEKRQFEYYDSEDKTWHLTPIIYNARIRVGTGVVKFYVADIIYDCILDFTKGFSKYNLEKALQLDSPYAVRLYALLCAQNRPQTYRVDDLKKMFGVESKYDQTADFIKKVIRPAQAKLDAMGMNSFNFEKLTVGRQIVAIIFTPVKHEEHAAAQVLAKLPLSAVVLKELKIVLLQKFGFSSRELSAHKELLDHFGRIPQWFNKLMDIEHRMHKGDKSKGWVIQAIRGEVKDFFG